MLKGGRFYRPAFEKQEGSGDLEWFNCAAASGAMLTDRATLGIKDPSVERFRKKTGDLVAGLHMSAVGNALEAFGVDAVVFDNDDHLRFDRLAQMVRRGQSAVIAGDYEVLPSKYKGDKDYRGDHSVLFWRMYANESVIGDPLNDGRAPGIHLGWMRWPNEIVRLYVKRFDQHTTGGIHAATFRQQFVKARSQVRLADIRLRPEKDAFLLGYLEYGKRLNTGGTVVGESIRGQERWHKVWLPTKGIGYIHTSVAFRA